MTTTELLLETAHAGQPNVPGFRLTLAADAVDVLAAQRLRFDVFGREFGATTPGPDGLDADRFDDLCDHLIVRRTGQLPSRRSGHDRTVVDSTILDPTGATGYHRDPVIATYRLLPPHAHDTDPRGPGLYSHTEFDLSRLEPFLDRTVEAGRSCVAAAHRGAAPISLLWGGIARYMQLTGYRYLMGCASISLADGGGNAAAFADLANASYLAPADLRCGPRIAFDTRGIVRPARPHIPPLLRGYLRLGAVVCAPPAHDTAFGTADFLVLLDLQQADPRYLRFFLGTGSRITSSGWSA